jgi:anti-anti-sigma regulatory factor
MNEAQINTFDEINGGVGIVFSGALVIENMAGVKEKIDWFCSSLVEKQVVVRIQEVSALDLSFVQLLVVFCNHLEKLGVHFSFDWKVDNEMQLLLKQTGFEKYA